MIALSTDTRRIADAIDTAAPPPPAHIILACLRAPDDVLSGLCAHPGVDWTRVAREAELHRVGMLALDRLQRSGVAAMGHVPPAVLARLREERREHVALAIKLDAALDGVLEACSAAGIPVVVLKGLALARLYPSPWLRPRSDLDLLIDPLHWPAADRVLTGMGYRLRDAEHVRRPLPGPRQAPDDRQYVRAADGTLIELHADYLSTGLRRDEDAHLWRRARTVEARGRAIPVLEPGDAFLQAATHMQRHAYTRLLWFYDLLMLLRREGDGIVWPEVARRAARAGVTTAAYYAISYTEALFGSAVPPAARIALRPNPLQRRLHEGMWERQRILSLDTGIIPRLDAMEQARQLPPTRFDAYDPPGRMLEHLLLSGNVRPKAAALGHRLLPTEEWLRYNGPERVALYRLRLLLARLSAASYSAGWPRRRRDASG